MSLRVKGMRRRSEADVPPTQLRCVRAKAIGRWTRLASRLRASESEVDKRVRLNKRGLTSPVCLRVPPPLVVSVRGTRVASSATG